MSRSGHVYVFQWNWECFFLRHREMNPRFNMTTIKKVFLHSLTGSYCLGVDSRTSCLFQATVPCHMRLVILCFQYFYTLLFSFALSLRACISDASNFPSYSLSANKVSPFQIFSATNAYPRNIPGNISLPNWWSLCRNPKIFNHCSERNDRFLKMVRSPDRLS